MNRTKRLLLLAGALALCCLGTLALSGWQRHQDTVQRQQAVILQVDAGAVQSLAWEYGGQYSFTRSEGGWQYDGDAAFPVSEQKLQQLLAPFASLSASFSIPDAQNLADYGLASPTATITLGLQDGTRYTITLGGYSTVDQQRYLTLGDGTVYLAEQDPLTAYDIQLEDLIQDDELPDVQRAQQLTAVFAGGESLTAVRQEQSEAALTDADVWFAQQQGGQQALDSDTVTSYLSTLASLPLTGCVQYDAGEADLAQYGLDAPELTLTVWVPADEQAGSEAAQATIQLGRDAATAANAQGYDEEGRLWYAYIRLEGSPKIYRISSELYKSLMACGYNDLRKSAIFGADFADVTAVEVTLEGQAHTFSAEPEGSGRQWYYSGRQIDLGNFSNDLGRLRAVRYTAEQPGGPLEIRLRFTLARETHPQIEVALYRVDGERCLAVVDGEPVAYVARSYAVDLIESARSILLGSAEDEGG